VNKVKSLLIVTIAAIFIAGCLGTYFDVKHQKEKKQTKKQTDKERFSKTESILLVQDRFARAFPKWKEEQEAIAKAEAKKMIARGQIPKSKEDSEAYGFRMSIPTNGGQSLETQVVPYSYPEREARKYAWLLDNIEKRRQQEAIELDRKRARERTRIWLEHIGSPLAPYTECMQAHADRVGSNVYMCAAVSMAESSGGLVNMAPHNAWGLMAHPSGFGCWEDGIAAFYDFLYQYDISRGYPAVDGHTTPNYCEPNEPWMTNVDQCVNDIKSIDPGF
jgi:hypothetical protein